VSRWTSWSPSSWAFRLTNHSDSVDECVGSATSSETASQAQRRVHLNFMDWNYKTATLPSRLYSLTSVVDATTSAWSPQ